MTEDLQIEHQRLKTHDSIMTERVLDLERQIDELRRLPKATEWIRTAERLPDDDTTVLMAMADGEVWVGYMDEGAWRYASADPCGVEVTHWADFPEHPEAKND